MPKSPVNDKDEIVKGTKSFLLILLLLLALVACRQEDPAPETIDVATPVVEVEEAAAVIPEAADESMAEPTATVGPTPLPTATPRPLKELTICLPSEPESLYLYGSQSLPATAVRHGIYENLYTRLSYGYQAQGLEKLPSLADGDALINQVEVRAGDKVVDSFGDIVTLSKGRSVINANGETVIFDEAPVVMPQMVVDFTVKPLVWSDGTPVTAEDSVYSFTVAADANTPGDKFKLERTAGYAATGPLSVRWQGVPGYLDPTYFTNVWQPLPQLQLARHTADELLTAAEANRSPLSSGPFMVEEWTTGERLSLIRNPHYYRAAEGLPRVDRVIFIVNETAALDPLLSGQCDVVTQDALPVEEAPALLSLEEQGEALAYFQSDSVFEHIDFGINSYSDYGDGLGRPDWFEDVRVRRAMTMCTDRQRMIDEVTHGRGEMMHAYVSSTHPLYSGDVTPWPYDPAVANTLLNEVGYIDLNGDGIREDPTTAITFTVTLRTDEGNGMRQRLTEIFQENMRDCGIGVELAYLPAAQWYADGPDGPLFGRRFDLAEFAWVTSVRPPCNLYLSQNVTGPEEEGFGGWGNVNATGWVNEAYDAACQSAFRALPGMPEYEGNHQEAVRIFSQELPIIPLFSHVKMAATRPGVLNFRLDVTQSSELWNLYELDLEQE